MKPAIASFFKSVEQVGFSPGFEITQLLLPILKDTLRIAAGLQGLLDEILKLLKLRCGHRDLPSGSKSESHLHREFTNPKFELGVLRFEGVGVRREV